MIKKSLIVVPVAAALSAVLITGWVAYPTDDIQELPSPLRSWTRDGPSALAPHDKDLALLLSGFKPQTYRSFCGPASIATVMRAYRAKSVDQRSLFPSFWTKIDTFYSGMSLADLGRLAEHAGLQTDVVYADTLDVDQFRERLKDNLSRAGDFVLVNYDRGTLGQSGAGHISPVAAYDASRDEFLVLDEAAYRYPFTWVPAPLLYRAVHTRAGDHLRGILFIRGVT